MDRVLGFLGKRAMYKEEQVGIREKIFHVLGKRQLEIKHEFSDLDCGIFVFSSKLATTSNFTWFEEQDGFVCGVEGYLYNREEALSRVKSSLCVGIDAEVLAKYYLEYGDDIVWQVKGQFSLFYYDKNKKDLKIITDRYGLKPLYFCETTDHYIYSHDFKVVLDIFPITKCLDRFAVAQFLSMGLVYDDRTMLESVKRVSGAAMIRCQQNSMAASQYWDYPFHETSYLSNRNQILELMNVNLERAVEVEFSKAPGVTAVPLSGGMDSRTIVAYAQRRVKDPLKVFTVGTKSYRSRERKYAQQLASAVNAEWHFEDLSTSLDISNRWKEFVEWTGGWQSVHQSWTFPGYQNICLNHGYQRVLSGYNFGCQLSSNPAFALQGNLNFSEILKGLLKLYHCLSPDLAERYFTKEFSEIISYEVKLGLEKRVGHLKGAQSSEIADYFFWNGRAKGYTVAEGVSSNRIVYLGMPYLDHDVFDLCMQIPPHIKIHRELHFELFAKQFPHLRTIPYAGTGLPIGQDPRMWRTINRMIDRGEYYVNRLTHGFLERTPISGPAWFRHSPLHRESILNLMSDQLVIEMGIMPSEGYKRLIKDITIGRNYAYGLLESLATIELFLKQFLNGCD